MGAAVVWMQRVHTTAVGDPQTTPMLRDPEELSAHHIIPRWCRRAGQDSVSAWEKQSGFRRGAFRRPPRYENLL